MEEPQGVPERYTLDAPLGHGAAGTVWRAHDSWTDAEVALKVVPMRGPQAGPSPGRFRREAEAAMAVTDPHVVRVLDAGTTPEVGWLAMELLPGPSVADLVAEVGPLPWARGIALAEGMARGLAAAHAVGVVHRDIKPSNVVLRGEDAVIVDFGIARLTESVDVTRTATGIVTGTAAYLAPEQALGDEVTAASDQYSLGCLLMTMFTGGSPFPAEVAVAQAMAHVGEAPPRLRDRRPDAPPALDELVARLLSKDPRQRPDAVATAAELARLREDQRAPSALAAPGPVEQTSALTRLDRMLDGSPAAGTTARPRRAVPTPAPRRALAAGAVALLALLLALAFVVTRPGPTPAPARTSAASEGPSPSPTAEPSATPSDTPTPEATPEPTPPTTAPPAAPPARPVGPTRPTAVPASVLAGVSNAVNQVGNPGARTQLQWAWADATNGMTLANADARVATFQASLSSMPQLTAAERGAILAALNEVRAAT